MHKGRGLASVEVSPRPALFSPLSKEKYGCGKSGHRRAGAIDTTKNNTYFVIHERS
ncbi:hypothetical protein KSX_01050 [Ktedonospora formicarum]|uniref:Uncharacterized protein n=1 Tax=Ktedonospora formicarum TaxID=2778364 RepID=A0A8J3HQI5_9CHLR|nr:hypothetical protein KSX_01050 [Ktedonospora formicarum]